MNGEGEQRHEEERTLDDAWTRWRDAWPKDVETVTEATIIRSLRYRRWRDRTYLEVLSKIDSDFPDSP